MPNTPQLNPLEFVGNTVAVNFAPEEVGSLPVDASKVGRQVIFENKLYVSNGTTWEDYSPTNGGVQTITSTGTIDIDNTDPENVEIDVNIPSLIDDSQSTGENIYSAQKVDSQISAAVTGLFEYKGAIDCSTNPNYPAAEVGDVYKVSVAGKIGGASGIAVEVGDTIYCNTDSTGGTQAEVGNDFDIIQANIDIEALAGEALVVIDGALDVNVDDSSIEINADALRVKDLGITNAMLAGSIADSKLSTITTANKVSGSAVQLATNSGLEDATGLNVVVDDSTIEKATNTIQVKDLGITEEKLADGSVTPAKKADKYSATFVSGDFTSDEFVVTEATHGLGATRSLIVIVQNSSGVEVGVGKTVAANGDVTISVASGNAFDGRIIILA